MRFCNENADIIAYLFLFEMYGTSAPRKYDQARE